MDTDNKSVKYKTHFIHYIFIIRIYRHSLIYSSLVITEPLIITFYINMIF